MTYLLPMKEHSLTCSASTQPKIQIKLKDDLMPS